jgi:hypothetical protein
MNWQQRCYVVIADSVPGMPPLLHSVQPTQWEAFRVMEEAHSTMPEKLTQNLRVVPALSHVQRRCGELALGGT